MKKLLVLLAVVCASLSASAQLASDIYSEEREREEHDGWLQTGYRGFAEIGVPIKLTCCAKGGFSINTSHGYQFSEWIYVGGGIGYTYIHDGNNCYIDGNTFNAFGDFKLTIPTPGRVYPFIGARVGVAVPDMDEGIFYLHIPVGIRIALNDNVGFNVGAAFNMYGWGPLCVGPFVSVDF